MAFHVKNTTLPGLLDLLAPHSCRGCGRIGDTLCDCCKNNILANKLRLCPNCKKTFPEAKSKSPLTLQSYKCPHCDLPPIIIVGEKSGLIESLIYDLKLNSNRSTAKSLAELLDKTLPTINGRVIIVPLPTATHHIRARGLDHTHLIAKHLAKLRGYDTQHLLIRAKNTVQIGADKKTRLIQAKSAYMLNPKLTVDSSATYLLLDDVWTTGASTKAAIELIKEGGAKSIAAALLALSTLD